MIFAIYNEKLEIYHFEFALLSTYSIQMETNSQEVILRLLWKRQYRLGDYNIVSVTTVLFQELLNAVSSRELQLEAKIKYSNTLAVEAGVFMRTECIKMARVEDAVKIGDARAPALTRSIKSVEATSTSSQGSRGSLICERSEDLGGPATAVPF